MSAVRTLPCGCRRCPAPEACAVGERCLCTHILKPGTFGLELEAQYKAARALGRAEKEAR